MPKAHAYNNKKNNNFKNMIQTMKMYSKPITETIDVRSAECFMQLGNSGDHDEVVNSGSGAPKRKFKIF